MHSVGLLCCAVVITSAIARATDGHAALRGHGRHDRGHGHASRAAANDGALAPIAINGSAFEGGPAFDYDRSGYEEDWGTEQKTHQNATLAPAATVKPGQKEPWAPADSKFSTSPEAEIDIARVTSQMIIPLCVNMLMVLIVALIYNHYRHNKPFPQQGDRARHSDSFTNSLFSCFGDCSLCVFSTCCPIIRWSDTVDKAGLLNYWCAIVLLLLLYGASPFLFGLGTLAIFALVVYNRQRLRAHFGMKHGDCGSFVEDVFTYCCCACCAIIQEAREIEMEP